MNEKGLAGCGHAEETKRGERREWKMLIKIDSSL
jgi:hypothetical protein